MENNPNGGTTPPNSNNDYETLAEFVTTSETDLTNALLPDVLPRLIPYQYTQVVIEGKIAEVKALNALALKQVKEYGDQYKATNDYNALYAQLNEAHTDHIELAREDFADDPAAIATLGLTGKRKRKQADYTKQALQFYTGVLANPDYTSAMANNAVSTAQLTELKDGYTQLEALATAQQKETGEAQEATALRDEAWDALEKWMATFYKKARIALKKFPQLMEKVGLKQ